jgi:hypothetical protein
MGTNRAAVTVAAGTLSAVVTAPVGAMSTAPTAVSTDRPTLHLSPTSGLPYTRRQVWRPWALRALYLQNHQALRALYLQRPWAL